MSSRTRILAALQTAQPNLVPLPLPVPPPVETEALTDAFSQQIARNGGTVIRVRHLTDIVTYLNAHLDQSGEWISTVPTLDVGGQLAEKRAQGHGLAGVELAVCAGTFGVAENGAIWLDEAQLPHRALPFLCQHLALVVAESSLVATLHDAYQLLDGRPFDYGVFIAGPSKTADIEQSLVIGAHGSRSLLVFLYAPTSDIE